MPRKSPRSLARELAAEQRAGDAEQQAETPSRTARKHVSEELQDLGAELVALRRERLAEFDLSDTLLAAIAEARRLTSFGAKRQIGRASCRERV